MYIKIETSLSAKNGITLEPCEEKMEELNSPFGSLSCLAAHQTQELHFHVKILITRHCQDADLPVKR
jgi:hypothetical protein